MPPSGAAYVKLLDGRSSNFGNYTGEAYDVGIVRGAVHSIATNGAKLKAKHVRGKDGSNMELVPGNVEYLLSVRPNPYMDAFSFHYKVITQLRMQNNAFVYPHWDETGRVLQGLYPINASSVEFLQNGERGELYARFRFFGGQELTVPYLTLIHLRHFFYNHDLWGEANDGVLTPLLTLVKTTDEGITNAIKKSAHLRGILQYKEAMLKATDLKKQQEDFVADYMSVNNSGGVAALDARAEYKELKYEPKIMDAKQMELIDKKVYNFFGLNEKIINATYTEQEWNSFYESVIEPMAIQMSLEYTEKLFTPGEKRRGNRIIFEANRLQYASIQTKLELVALVDRGAMSPNSWLEVFNLPPVPGGDELIRRLDTAPTAEGDKPKPKPGDKPKPKEGEDDDPKE
jgi:HK97 family phage portal protein